MREHMSQSRNIPILLVHNMRARRQYNLPMIGPISQHSTQIGEHATRAEQGRLLAEQLGHLGFELPDGRVFAHHVVAEGDLEQAVAHGLGRLGHGV